jgi:hypothetical protein
VCKDKTCVWNLDKDTRIDEGGKEYGEGPILIVASNVLWLVELSNEGKDNLHSNIDE